MIHQDYDLVHVLGSGQGGEVWEARKRETGERVAVKTSIGLKTLPDLVELDILSRFSHPNLLHLIDFSVERRKIEYILPLARTTLSRISVATTDEETKRRWAYELLSAVGFMHDHGTVHCDIKLDNLLLVDDKIVLGDFGLVAYLSGKVAVCQSIATSAPEILVVLHNFELTAPKEIKKNWVPERINFVAADIWAVGCIMFYMATGNPLLPGPSALNGRRQMQRFLDSPLDYFKVKGIDDELREVLEAILNPNTTKRVKSVEELLSYPYFSDHGYSRPITGLIIQGNSLLPADQMSSIMPGIEELMRLSKKYRSITASVLFHTIDLLYRLPSPTLASGKKGPDAIFYLSLACLYIIDGLYARRINLNLFTKEYQNMRSFDIMAFAASERWVVLQSGGILSSEGLYEAAFSGESLLTSLSLLLNPEKYSQTDLIAFMAELEAIETPEERQNRTPKDVVMMKLLTLNRLSEARSEDYEFSLWDE